MAPPLVRELRRVLRYRNFLVRQAVNMKNKTTGLLMEVGAEYDAKRVHQQGYFSELLDSLHEVPPSVVQLLRTSRSGMELFQNAQKELLEALVQHEQLRERVEVLRSIKGVGEVTALTWALEIDDPARFSNLKKAHSYCGLCSGQNESAGKNRRAPLSKQRNPHLQTVLIEAAKLAPRGRCRKWMSGCENLLVNTENRNTQAAFKKRLKAATEEYCLEDGGLGPCRCLRRVICNPFSAPPQAKTA